MFSLGTCGWITGAVIVAIVGFLWIIISRPKSVDLNGKRVIITGGSSGIGKSTAIGLVKAGASVSIIAQNQQRLKETVAELEHHKSAKSVVHCESADVGDYDSVTRAINGCIRAMGGVDILITSAGYSRPGHFDEVPLADWEGQMRVNYLGTIYSIKGVLDTMKKQKFGRILLVSSLGGMSGVAGLTSYTPTKFALRGLAEGLHMELLPYGIAVSVVNPPDVDTPLLAREMAFKPDECKEISAGSGLFSAEQIAKDILAGIKNWTFFINTGFDGHASGVLCCGTAPCATPQQALFEIVTLPIMRLVGLAYTWRFNSIVNKWHRSRRLT